jgi:KUP system potassium uptake protein
VRTTGAAPFVCKPWRKPAPAALLHNLKHNQILHDNIIVLTVKTSSQPYVNDDERVHIDQPQADVATVQLTFGYMESPNIIRGLALARERGIRFDIMTTSFFLSRRSLSPTAKGGMPLWQDHLFIFLARNATNATEFFHIPTARVVELGNQISV